MSSLSRRGLAGPGHGLRAPLKEGLALLLQAYRYAEELERPLSDFALEVAALRQAGLSASDLRSLVCRGLVQHYLDCTRPLAKRRTLYPTDHLSLTAQSCFVLTAEGLAQAIQITQPDSDGVPAGPAAPPHPSARPCWDGELRELWFEGELLKRQQRPAPNQDTILAAFEEEDWRPRIDDPIPPVRDRDSIQCLHDTVKRLNASLLRPRLRFHCDGTGRGVRWEPTP